MGNDSLAFRLFRPLADKLARDRSVGEAVETVAFDAVLIEFPRQCEAPHQLGICPVRSEEHTSELQSLMRISYAVFCLKKKRNNQNIHTKKFIYNLIHTNHDHQ